MTRISFIMPTFNRADYIAQSLDAVLAQMSPDDELVVVDDGSSDGTEEAVKPYLDRLRYLRQDNAGKSVALNRAMEVTGGEYVWICDDDDLLRPGVVARMVSEIESAGVDMVFGRYTRFRIEDGARVEMGAGYWPDLGRGSVARHILEDAFVMHNASLVRRAAYDRLGPFDPRMLRSQDYEMFVRLALRATIRFVDTVVFDQRKHEGARGPAVVKHAASASDTVWQKYDAMIFDGLTRDAPLSFFEAMFAADAPDLITRAARLQRGTILARHGLWDAALTDFEASVSVAPDTPLSREEMDILWRAVAGKHGFAGLLEDGPFARLQALKSSPFGREILREVTDGLVWALRSEEPQVRADARAFLKRAGWGGPVLRWVQRRVGLDRTLPEIVTEMRQIPPLA